MTSFAATQYQKWLSCPDALIKVACLFTEVPGNREIVMHAIPLSFLLQENRVAVAVVTRVLAIKIMGAVVQCSVGAALLCDDEVRSLARFFVRWRIGFRGFSA